MIPEILRLTLSDTISLPIYSFGLMILCCFIGAMKLLELKLKSHNIDPLLAEPMVTIAAVSGIVGARVFSIFSHIDEFIADPLHAIFNSAGFVYYGGFIGGALGVIFYLKRKGYSSYEFSNLVAAPLAFGYAIGRLGCQLSGDGDYGSETSFFLGMNYAYGVIPTAAIVHPTPVYESVAAIGITIVLTAKRVQMIFSSRGQLFGLYLILMSVERFFVEFARIEPVLYANLTQAQIISMVLLPLGAFMICAPLLRKSQLS